MMFYKNGKVMVHLPVGNTEFFDIVAGVLQIDTLAPYIFIIYRDYVLRTSIDLIKENSFTLKKKKKQMISCRNYDRRRLIQRFLQIHLPRPDPNCFARSKQQEALCSK